MKAMYEGTLRSRFPVVPVAVFVSTTIVTPFVATIWTLVYYRLLGQKQEAQAPAPEAAT